jgi:PAS domain S-box-containing protein
MLLSPYIDFCDALLDPVAIVNDKGHLVFLNRAMLALLGYSNADRASLDLASLMPAQRHPEQHRQFQACLQGKEIIAVPSELQTRDGRHVPALLTVSLFRPRPSDDPLLIWAFKQNPDASPPPLERLNLFLEDTIQSKEQILDHTVNALEAEASERREVEKELAMSRRQLRLLIQKTLELLESDRQMIAKELHDSIGASLAAIKFSLEGWMETYGEQLPSTEIPFDRIIRHIMETIKETKRISANLRPTTLDDLGLLATAQWFCRNLSGLYQGIQISPRFDVSEVDIPEALKIVLYRVMQEALSNAAKHGQARHIQVSLVLVDGYLELTISDDGCGFDQEMVLNSEDTLSGYGINSMRERVEICDGHFHIQTRIGEGTRIKASLPVGSRNVVYQP